MTTETRPVADVTDPEKQWPGVVRAYDFVLPSYQMLTGRFEAADNRLTAVLNFAATITLGIPVLAKSIRPDISFRSPLFIAAVAMFLLAGVVGVVGRLRGRLVLPDPMVFYKTWLHESDWAFRKDAIYFAAVHFDQNTQAVRTKGNMALVVTVLFMVEILSLLLWIAR